MLVEVGKVVEGKVSGITSFGAFIQLPDGKTGLVHISEVADEYVKDINTHLKDSQVVKVKIISVDKNGKISLSAGGERRSPGFELGDN
jgi:S1 RNA binding domain protein